MGILPRSVEIVLLTSIRGFPIVYEFDKNAESKGAGLGLYIAKTISNSLGYNLTIDSKEREWANVAHSIVHSSVDCHWRLKTESELF